MKDTAQDLATLGIKQMFTHVDKGEQEIQMLKRKNDILKGYIQDMVGPIDLDHPKVTLKAALEKQALTPLDS